jgi:hypothetical protein
MKRKPRLRWIDDMEEDLRNTGIKRRRIKALARAEWASTISQGQTERAVVLQGEEVPPYVI